MELSDAVEAAFKGVRLGHGIGLEEAQAIDDYADDATRAAARARDEREDWRNLTSQALNRCYSSLSFFDAEGMRFHLPAFIQAELKGEFNFGLASSLTHRSDFSAFELLTEQQREVVRAWLRSVDQSERVPEEYWNA